MLKIQRIKNGWIVYADKGMGIMGDQWVFETAEGLAEFILHWGQPYNNEPWSYPE